MSLINNAPAWFFAFLLILIVVWAGLKLGIIQWPLFDLDKQILVMLADRYRRKDPARPYASTIAKRLKRPVPRIKRSLYKMQRHGFVASEKDPPVWLITSKGLARIGVPMD